MLSEARQFEVHLARLGVWEAREGWGSAGKGKALSPGVVIVA